MQLSYRVRQTIGNMMIAESLIIVGLRLSACFTKGFSRSCRLHNQLLSDVGHNHRLID